MGMGSQDAGLEKEILLVERERRGDSVLLGSVHCLHYTNSLACDAGDYDAEGRFLVDAGMLQPLKQQPMDIIDTDCLCAVTCSSIITSPIHFIDISSEISATYSIVLSQHASVS